MAVLESLSAHVSQVAIRYRLFESEAKVDENWETLIRALFGRPLYQKPALDAPPAYVTAPQESSRPSASKFLSWRQVGARHVIR